MTALVFLICVVVAAGSMIVALAVNIIFYGLIRRRFPDTWLTLGSPSGVGLRMSQMGPVQEFFRSRTYLSLGDPQLARLGRVLVVLRWLLLAAMGMGLITFMAAR
jgi:hypothetical protein